VGITLDDFAHAERPRGGVPTLAVVIAGLDPAIHAAFPICGKSEWMRGSSPRMTM
jgi:hypothetical protein